MHFFMRRCYFETLLITTLWYVLLFSVAVIRLIFNDAVSVDDWMIKEWSNWRRRIGRGNRSTRRKPAAESSVSLRSNMNWPESVTLQTLISFTLRLHVKKKILLLFAASDSQMKYITSTNKYITSTISFEQQSSA
jgi:hypothetical protein